MINFFSETKHFCLSFAGKFEYRVTEESLMDRLTTDTHAACLLINQNCRLENASIDCFSNVHDTAGSIAMWMSLAADK